MLAENGVYESSSDGPWKAEAYMFVATVVIYEIYKILKIVLRRGLLHMVVGGRLQFLISKTMVSFTVLITK